MVVIRVELWPRGARNHDRFVVLAEAQIENIGGTMTSGNYRYRLFGKGRRLMGTGDVIGYKRVAHHTWRLIKMVLDDFYKDRPRRRTVDELVFGKSDAVERM